MHPIPKFIANHPFKPFEHVRLDKSLHDCFRETVVINSDHRAICDPENDFSYAQLDAASSFIAQRLLAASQGNGAKTALLFNQGVLLTSAILGVLKSGGIYVPIDPGYPVEWNALILEDAGCSSILCSDKHAELASMLTHERQVILNVDARCANYEGELVSVNCDPDSVACIYFTSGSTGRAKGVCDTHRSVLHNVMRYTNALHISNNDCLSLIQSPVFSGTLSSLFGALLNGASIASLDLQRWGLDAVPEWVREQGVTIFHSVPSIFQTLALVEARYPKVRVIRLEGDQSSDRDFQIFKRLFEDGCVLANGLGATECGLIRQYLMHKSSVINHGLLPLGYAVQDMEILILDETGIPLGKGEVGEIAVRSSYMAKEYLNQREFTDSRFVDCTDGSGCRTYLTGDLGVLDKDDCLHFRGRKNQIAKVNGLHVDLAQIESVLENMTGIHQAVAHIRADDPDSPYLVSYLVSGVDNRPSVELIRTHLASKLPKHMIPTRVMWLDSIPLTSDHKIDRPALPVPPLERPLLETKFVAPRDPDEMRLAKIWEELLCVSPIGVYDSFFHLGADSLTAILLISRIRSNFNVSMSIATIFKIPTIEGLCKEIQALSPRNQNTVGPG